MPTIRVINETQVPLHIALCQVGPLHWQNGVSPGSAAVLNPGPVFFTIEARIDRGKDNEYTKLQCFVPIAVVSISVVTLGAGAVYFASAAAAAGGASALVANISAQLATKAPTIRRLYKYARRGQQISRIGNIVGIGGSVLAGKKVAEAEAAHEEKEEQGGMFSGFMRKKTVSKKQQKKQTNESMKILQGLVAGSVISSPGWFLNRDRTLKLTGGPRATEVDGLLIIETDTVEPFKIVEEDTGKTLAKGKSEQELLQAGEQAQLAAAAEAAKAGQGANAPALRRTKSTPDQAALEAASLGVPTAQSSDSDSDSDDESISKPDASKASTADTVKGKFAEWGASLSEMTDGALQRGATMYSRFRPGAKGPQAGAEAKTAKEQAQPSDPTPGATAIDEKVPAPEAEASKDNKADATGAQDDEDVSPLEALLQMGFSPIEANDALRQHSGDLKGAIEELLAKDSAAVRKLAMTTPLPSSPPVYGDSAGDPLSQVADSPVPTPKSDAELKPQAASERKPDVSVAATLPSGMSTGTPAPPTPPAAPPKAPLKVVGGETIETPHWTTKAREAAAAATSSELGKIAVEQVVGRSKAFLEGKPGAALSPSLGSRGKAAVGGASSKQKGSTTSSSLSAASWLRRSKSQEPAADSAKKRF
ncbi:hypothetical protein OC842_002416 [Tilletia horrida]|uniref:UBA domain-containing protein n=1 Tax=Tilletia horrida TaxID=155126 RepID=A0AAN6JMC8_9BASI|nr:hypothetical protein OC842_002416 [Tilletia horrida]